MIIGISGKCGTGKSTLARYLAGLMGGLVVSFADCLREEIRDIFGIPIESTRDRKDSIVRLGRREMTVRELMQWWGTEVRRKQDPAYWVNALWRNIGVAEICGEVFVIDDVRFPEEADAIREWGGLLVRLLPYGDYQPIAAGADHESETALDNYFFEHVYAPPFGQLELSARDIADKVTKFLTLRERVV